MAPPRTMHWFRWHHNTTNDHALRRIAAHSHTSVANVVAVWACVLESASESPNRGVLGSWDTADVAFVLGVDEEIVVRIYASMQGQVLDGQRVINWHKRNPKREDERPHNSRRTPHNPDEQETPRKTPPEERRGEESSSFSKKKNARAKSAPFMGRVTACWNIHFPGASPPPGTATALQPLYKRLSEDDATAALDAYLARTPADMINLGKFAATCVAGPKAAPATAEIEGVHYTIHDWRKDPLPVFEPGH